MVRRKRHWPGITAAELLAQGIDAVRAPGSQDGERARLMQLRDGEVTVLPGWAGDYYGIPVQSTLDAIRLTGRLEGRIIDPVYEGKSMAGLIDLVRAGEIGSDSTVFYAHLGGQPAINAYSALFR